MGSTREGSSSAGERDDRTAVEELIDDLRRRGQRATTARRAVLEELLVAEDDHLSADQLADRVSRTHPSIHLSTIYRTLESLDEAGLITKAPIADQPVSYHLTHDVHHHAVCSGCGKVLNLSPLLFDDLTQRLAAEHGFRADPQHLTISGLCGDCVS